VKFKKITLSDKFYSEGASAGDERGIAVAVDFAGTYVTATRNGGFVLSNFSLLMSLL